MAGPQATLLHQFLQRADELFVARLREVGLPEPPLVIAVVTLDGADSAILNFAEGVDLSDSGAAGAYLFAHDRVRVVFSEKRAGRITDFHFESIPA